MKVNAAYVSDLVSKLPLGEGHKDQEGAVAAALRGMLIDGHWGMVLADEVGFGKTYEALAVMALLCDHSVTLGEPFDHVLVLCKSSLLRKWEEEVSSMQPGRGFPQYLTAGHWCDHPVQGLLRRPHVVERRWSADELRKEGLRGRREEGRIQAPPGLYIVNHDLLSEASRQTRLLLGQLWRTKWDLIIVDEAHHYAKLNRPAEIFAPDRDLRNYDQGISDGRFVHILALTATPFELTPHEMMNLLALVRAEPTNLETIEKGLELYVQRLNQFFALRQRSPSDPLRAATVDALRHLRDEDALGSGQNGVGLQELLRRYIIRNTKSQNERRYFLVNKADGRYDTEKFDKLDDLHERVRSASLLPFDGADAIFYLELRELIQETMQPSQKRTFIPNDLRQGLSSYPQVQKSALLRRDLDGARQLSSLLKQWNNPRSLRLHPKVQACVDVVVGIASAELEKLRSRPRSWVSKVLVFNKLIEGTAPQLREQLSKALGRLFDDCVDDWLRDLRLGSRKQLASRFRSETRLCVDRLQQRLRNWRGEHSRVPREFRHDDLHPFKGRWLLDVYKEPLLRRSQQTLFLLHGLQREALTSDRQISDYVERVLVEPVEMSLRKIIDNYLDDKPSQTLEEATLLDLAEREALVLLESSRSVDIVGRYDGGNVREREAHRRNFNQPYNPFVLLVSRVGEEGIDLQEQCRYVVHYDLEWNPARMEQREGRVDRVGWGRADEKFIDVRFFLLKGTYEERIFHAVMQRDQWFQILIGSKRRELGELSPDERNDEAKEVIEDVTDLGRLTPGEKAAVMLDLRPLISS
ncbi:MAG: DEAD/DEAH box helicase family protein [Deltaproteobacteria bacterium]|nr:DEAD/DEAH box helicase family protein [Deltaproteobacteria bacterium]